MSEEDVFKNIKPAFGDETRWLIRSYKWIDGSRVWDVVRPFQIDAIAEARGFESFEAAHQYYLKHHKEALSND